MRGRTEGLEGESGTQRGTQTEGSHTERTMKGEKMRTGDIEPRDKRASDAIRTQGRKTDDSHSFQLSGASGRLSCLESRSVDRHSQHKRRTTAKRTVMVIN